MGDIITMSIKELERLDIIKEINEHKLTQKKGAKKLKISYRQMKRIMMYYRNHGIEGVISKKRGKKSNNRLSEDLKEEVKKLISSNYADIGPTFVTEKLLEDHQKKLSRESVRKLMIEWKMWKNKKQKVMTIHQQRYRRSCFGELIQIDGSPHDWFEGRGNKCCLIVFIDDATSKIVQMRFFPAETTLAYFECVKRYIKKYGRPLAFYSDRHNIFRVNFGNNRQETQFERAMKELGIEIICANSPQAKGRVERANRTLQDRLVKNLRLKNISDIESANRYIEEFVDEYNNKFEKKPIYEQDKHRKFIPDEEILEMILCERDTRKLTKNLELSFEGTLYQIKLHKKDQGNRLKKQSVQICRFPDNRIKLWYRNRFLDYQVSKHSKKATDIISSKEIDVKIDKICTRVGHKPSKEHPWRRSYFLNMISNKVYEKRDIRINKS